MTRPTPDRQCVHLFDDFSRNPVHVEERIIHSVNTLYTVVCRGPGSVRGRTWNVSSASATESKVLGPGTFYGILIT